MSYSFQTKSSSKAEAKQKVFAELKKVVESQPIHAADVLQAQAVADAFIDLLADGEENMDVNVNVNGSLGWRGHVDEPVIGSANVGVSAYFSLRPVFTA